MRAADRPRVLIAGGGVAALEAALALDELGGGRLGLTMLSASPDFQYGPLSVAEPFGLGRAHRFSLEELLAGRNVEVAIDSLEGLDGAARRARLGSGQDLGFDALLVAIGALKQTALPGAVTFSGSRASAELGRLLREAESGAVRRLAFAVPRGITWSLPIYELALMSAAHFAERRIGATVAVVSPERWPVEVFGEEAGSAVAEMLRLREVEFRTAVPAAVEPGSLTVEEGEPLAADAVVALPRLEAPRIAGLAADSDGFVPVDAHGRVAGSSGVYAAGDVTDFPLKQGGIATQQADAAAEAIASDLGEEIEPSPFRPRLRGLLLTGSAPPLMRAEVMRSSAGSGSAVEAARWPPAKIAGRRVGPLLAHHGAFGGAPPGAVALELDAVPTGLSPQAGRGSSGPRQADRR